MISLQAGSEEGLRVRFPADERQLLFPRQLLDQRLEPCGGRVILRLPEGRERLRRVGAGVFGAGRAAGRMLPQALFDVRRDAGIKTPVPAAEHIDIVHALPVRQRVGDRGEAGDIQRLAAHRGRKAARGDHVRERLLVKLRKAGGQRIEQRLAPLGEGRAHDLEEHPLVADLTDRLFAHRELQNRARDLRLRDEAAGRNVKQQLRLGIILAEDAERAVFAPAWGRADALCDLLLYHDGHGLERPALEQSGQDRRRDIVRQIRAGHRAQARKFLFDQRRDIGLQDVAEDDLQILISRHRLSQHGLERPVDLDRDDLFRVPAQLLRERPDARPDLEHAAGPVDPGLQHDILRYPALRQEILPLGLGKMEPMPGQQRLDFGDITKIHKKSAFPTGIIPDERRIFNQDPASFSTYTLTRFTPHSMQVS